MYSEILTNRYLCDFFKVKTDLDTIQWEYMYSHKQLKYHIMI